MSITVTVTGRLTSAPVLRRTHTGKQVTTFNLVHNFRSREGATFADVAAVFFRVTGKARINRNAQRRSPRQRPASG